jgi:Glycosyltransferase family 87
MQTALAAGLVTMVAAAAIWLSYELYRLLVQPASIGSLPIAPRGVDLELPHAMATDWFAGAPVYTGRNGERHPHPPASMAILWPVYGWPSLATSMVVYLVVTLVALAWIVVVAVRESGATSPLERMFVAFVPLATYPAGATIGNGQTTVYVLAALLAALLLLRDRPPGWGRDLAAAGLLLVSLAKPSVSAPFVLVALVMTGGMRPVALLAGAYVALTLFAASYQPLSLHDQFAHFLAHASRIGALHDDVNLHALVAWLGLRSWMAGASAAVLALMAWWLWQHRRCDLWLLLGVTVLATRFWTYHRWYDDLLVVVPRVTLFRLAKGGANAPDRRAGALFALTLVLLLAPGGLYLLPPPWVHAYVGAQAFVWISVMGFLAMLARREMADRRRSPASPATRD